MTKEEISTRWDQCHQEQQQLAAEVAQKSARIQQLAGQKELLKELHDKETIRENPITVLPDPPKEDATKVASNEQPEGAPAQ